MAATTNKDIGNKVNDLERKVDSIAQRQDEVLIPGISDIKEQMKNFAYVSQKDYTDDQKAIWDAIDGLRNDRDEDRKLTHTGTLKFLNNVNNGVVKAITAVFVLAALFIIVYGLLKTVPGLGGQ